MRKLQQLHLRRRIAGFTKPPHNIAYRNGLKRPRNSREQKVGSTDPDRQTDGFYFHAVIAIRYNDFSY